MFATASQLLFALGHPLSIELPVVALEGLVPAYIRGLQQTRAASGDVSSLCLEFDQQTLGGVLYMAAVCIPARACGARRQMTLLFLNRFHQDSVTTPVNFLTLCLNPGLTQLIA